MTKKRISQQASPALEHQPFGALGGLHDLPAGPAPKVPMPEPAKAFCLRGRIEVRREKSGRGGKEVTTISGPALASATPKVLHELALVLKKHCGVGGTTKEQHIELQGNHVDTILEWLKAHGCKQAVKTGG